MFSNTKLTIVVQVHMASVSTYITLFQFSNHFVTMNDCFLQTAILPTQSSKGVRGLRMIQAQTFTRGITPEQKRQIKLHFTLG